ncbi:cupin domain-containing protein [Streptomyces erythrochromogenes]|uniref:cupin domain-containing protein n=1 Tax=Streptomyces erythrochromogenes TaxID=285574 RepID=UPI0037D39250
MNQSPRSGVNAHTAYQQLDAMSVGPLWRHLGDLFPAQPPLRAIPFHWSYEQLRPLMEHFATALSIEEAQRRVLMLINPGMQDTSATVTGLYAGIQIILPGEQAQAHRHSSNAFRYIIEGSGAYTTVAGERVHMSPGDLLLTPGWDWHDHFHQGDGPMTWLDGLDFPLVNLLDTAFFELHPETAQKTTIADDLSSRQYIHGRLNPTWTQRATLSSPIGKYPWAETERAFAAIADHATGSEVDGISLEYTNPWTGGPVLPTISCRVQRLIPGFLGTARRHTAATILHVVRGEGRTVINGEEFAWKDKDVFVVPSWASYQHIVDSSAGAVLFAYSNEPVVKALGLYREELL